MEKALHQFITNTFRLGRRTKRKIIKFAKGVAIIFLFFTTYSSNLNPEVVDRHPILFFLHDQLINLGFLFAFFCFLYAGGIIENSTMIGWTDFFISLIWVGIGSGTAIILGSINGIWNT